MKALREIGLKKTTKFICATGLEILFAIMVFPPLRSFFLQLMGAKIGRDCIIQNIRFLNLYRGTFANLTIGDCCFLGGEVLLDLADKISLGNQVTLAERTIILTHINVGYHDHPLQKFFPAFSKPTSIEEGSFIGVNSTILAGVTIGKCVFVAAGSVVNQNVPSNTLVGGVPAKVIRLIHNS